MPTAIHKPGGAWAWTSRLRCGRPPGEQVSRATVIFALLLVSAVLLGGALAALTLPADAGLASSGPPAQSIAAKAVPCLVGSQGFAVVPITITAAGFDPQVVTASLCAPVQWTNTTAVTQSIVAGTPGGKVYLPLILKDAVGSAALAAGPSPTLSAQDAGWGGEVPANGGLFTHTFTTTGTYPYYLAASPGLTGVVIVQQLADFVMDATPLAQIVPRSGSVTYTIQLTQTGVLSPGVALTATDALSGTSFSWSANPVTPTASAVLTVTAATTAPTGVHLLTILSSDGCISHTTTVSLTVVESSGPDLAIQAINWTPGTMIISKTFELTVTVANLGATDVITPFRVDWYLDPVTVPVSTTPGVYSWTVASLAAGTSEALTATWMITAAGVHTFYAQADVGNAIAEDNEDNNLLGPLTVTVESSLKAYLPIVLKNYWPGVVSQWRFGFDVHGGRGNVDDYDVALVRAGWYYDATWRVNPSHKAGLEYMQTVRVGNQYYPPNWSVLSTAIGNNPGSWWLIGNEPDRRVYQDDCEPARYAQRYHDLYYFIKGRDPTARVAPGSIVQPTPLRLQYLDMILAEYKARYTDTLPADGWNIHNMILHERSCAVYPYDCWGAEIPPGISASQGMLYGIQDNDNMTYFRNQIVAFRQWMKTNGYQNMPLIVSEYGVNMPALYGFNETRVINYMYATFNYFLNAKNCTLGYPADGCRLVQQWAWYSLNDQMYVPPPNCNGNDCGYNGNLFDPATRQITAFGTAYRNRPYY
jgi:plastocyanin